MPNPLSIYLWAVLPTRGKIPRANNETGNAISRPWRAVEPEFGVVLGYILNMTDPASEAIQHEEVVESLQDVFLGKVLAGRYKIESIIGHGGFGYVYRATHLSLDIPIAIKVMHSHIKNDVEKLRRFENEAKVLAKIESSHVVKTMDYGLSPVAFIVMEFVQGSTMDKMLADKSVTVSELLAIFQQVCSGLKAAHSIGLVHRDLKPSNIMISKKEDGVLAAKILDFGIAKINCDEHTESNESKLTMTGEIMGSPAYMSPEQWMARSIDQRSDIYSLGCVMYEAFAGAPLYKAVNAFDYLNMHVNGEFKPFANTPAGPHKSLLLSLEQIIKKCTEKDPADRYQDMSALLADLQLVSGGKKIRFKKRLSLNKSLVPALAMGIFLLAALALAAYNYTFLLGWAVDEQVKSADSLAKRGRTNEAIDSYKFAVSLARYLPAPNINNLHSLNQLSKLLDKNGQFAEARAFAKERKTAVGDYDDADITKQLNQLSYILDTRGDGRYIIKSCKQAENLSISRHGKDTIQRAKILSLEGRALRDGRQYLASERTLNEALALMEGLDFKDEEVYALTLYALGSCLDSLRRHGEATVLYQRSLKIAEERKSPTTSLILNNLAMNYYHLGNFDKAVPLVKRAIEMSKLQESPLTSNLINNFGVLLVKMKRYDEAITTLQDALLVSKTDGRNHHTTGEDILGNLAAAYAGAGQLKNALQTYKDNYEFKSSYNPKDPSLPGLQQTIKDLEAKIAAKSKA